MCFIKIKEIVNQICVPYEKQLEVILDLFIIQSLGMVRLTHCTYY